MLKRFKENYNHSHLQFILTDIEGKVLESDSTVLDIQNGTQIGEVHPFFSSIPEIIASLKESMVFRCIQLGTTENLLTVDIEISKKEEQILIVISPITTANIRPWRNRETNR